MRHVDQTTEEITPLDLDFPVARCQTGICS
jgi:hypothetical protein